jgi:DNA topoisomerase I
MAKNLVIVESPAKAKTIEGFLGKDFRVKSSFGHVRDLSKKGISIDVEKNYQPVYEVLADKKDVIAELKKIAKESDTVWLATDEDREGEAISWHLFETLKLDDKKTKRIVFHEITKSAITKAIENPRKIDKNLVDAQQARRILDRLVGFELSPLLWKKIKPSLSAGRVQSVAVRLLVEREREVNDFQISSAYKITAIFDIEAAQLKAELAKRFNTKEDAHAFLSKCIGADFTIKNLETKPHKKSPAPPFTTSTLQQEAARKLGFSVAQTMVVAQRLYESGKITYMRTDSVNLSDTAMSAAKDEIINYFGKEYTYPRQYKNKSKGAQEAHEAIRPSYMNQHTTGGDSAEQRLYEMIWKRTLASQMSDAELEKTTATIGISTTPETLQAQGEVIKFDGFLKVYMESSDEEEEEQKGMLPPLKVGEKLKLNTFSAIQRFTQHPARYTEASLVKKLEELGIGRPSTYAPTISTVQKRGYVVKEDRPGIPREFKTLTIAGNVVKEETKTEVAGAEKSKLFPTDIGMVVNDFLVEHFKSIMDYHFTAKVEKEFDEIAEGQEKWGEMIDRFYKTFHKTVEDTLENSEKVSGERLLGEDPKTGKPVYARIGKFGPLVQLGDSENEEKPKFASLRNDQRLEQITLEDALELFKLPRTIDEYEGEELVVSVGRFGPYIRHKKAFYSLGKADDPLSIEKQRAIEIIEAKRKADRERVVKTFEGEETIQVLNGRFGPYIAAPDGNFKIPKGTDPGSLSLEDCLTIIKETPKTKKPSRGKKAPAKAKKLKS